MQSRRRSPSGAGRRCRASRARHGSAPRRAGSRRCRSTRSRQFEVGLALGEHRELTPAIRAAVADNPFRERLWGQLMVALYRKHSPHAPEVTSLNDVRSRRSRTAQLLRAG
ncbi:MAG: hypothetical protein E6F98_08820 [Actinobacteria bacterium]|nr:MAG: hypothetical protein E6F98_08820 [Actinomycetota bacterium]